MAAPDYSAGMGNPRIGLVPLLRRWWLAVLLATVGGALVAYAFGSQDAARFEAQADVLVEAPAGLAPTYAEMVKSTPVLAYAVRNAKPGLSVGELREDVRGESDQDTRIVTIQVEASKGSEAIALANAIAAGLRRYASSQPPPDAPGEAQTPGPRVQLVDAATTAVKVRPRPLLLIEFGAFAGLLAGLAFVLVAEARRPRVSNEDDLLEVSRLPVLGTVNGNPPAVAFAPGPAISTEGSASYRRLVTRIALASGSEAPRSLVVVGVDDARGSCKVVVNLARQMVQDGLRVVLADFEGVGLRRHFGIQGRRSRASLMKAAEPVTCAGLTLDRYSLRSGPPLVVALPRVVPRALSAENAEALVTLLSADADIVIVHGPSPNRSRGAIAWARATEATLLVVTARHTRRAEVEEAVAALESARSKVVGAVLQTGATGPDGARHDQPTHRAPQTRERSANAGATGSPRQ
jgi:capsular polysaccharide biosynthesis protein